LEVLEARIAPAIVTWTNPAGGDWDTAANWSTKALPGATDDVVINTLNAGASVTHSQSTTDTVKSITAAVPITLSGGTLKVSGGLSDTSSVSLAGGTLANANVQTGTTLQGAGGALDGVTLGTGSTLVMPGGQSVAVSDGLTVDGTVDFTGSNTWLRFSGATPTVGGTGTIESTYTGGSTAPGLLTETNNATLTLGKGLTIDGGTMYIGPDSGGGVPNGSVVNHATLTAAGPGTLYLGGQAMTGSGTVQVIDGGSLVLYNSATINTPGILAGQAGTTIIAYGNLLGATRNAEQYGSRGRVTLTGSGTAAAPQLLEAMSNDLGNVGAGLVNNFAYGQVALANNTYVRLVDNAHNSAGTGAEAVYAESLIVPAGTTLDLNGLHFYARAAQINGTVLNGSVRLIPDGGPVPYATPTPGTISQAGAVDDWTFFGRAGQTVQVLVSTGNGSLFAPLSPSLNFAQVQLIGPNKSVVATASNAASGTDAALQTVTLPADGIYHILVKAGSSNSSNTGGYVLSLWDSPVHTAALTVNEPTFGQLISPYAVDKWTFSATVGQQVRFNLLNTAVPGFLFDLTGPNGFTAFSNATSSSNLIDLPFSGTYTLTVHTTQPAQGAYSFEMQQTSVTPLTSGVAYNGVFAGNGQPQLFTINMPQDKEMLISLRNSNPNDQIEVYAKFGSAPTRDDYQYKSAVPQSVSQSIVIPSAAPGTWYILVYATSVPAWPENYTLTATVAPVTLTAITPDRLGNAADAVLTLTGAGFDSTTTVSLVAGNGTTYQANQVQLDLPTQLTATFTAGTVPAGVYSVVVRRSDGASSTLSNAFTMDQGGAFNFHANLVTPSTLGYHVASTLYLQYSNTGDLAMPAPILTVTVFQTHANGTTDQKALLTLDSSIATQGLWTSSVPAGFSNSIQILASGAIPGVLEPGESIQVPIYWAGWQQPWDIPAYPNFQPELGIENTSDTTPIPWSTLQANFQPPNINTTAWNAMFPNLEAQVGNTWGAFVQRMDNDASYLGHLGEKVTDLSQLWSFEVQQADGFTALRTLHNDTDASVPTPGPALAVHRVFFNSIQARNQMDPFGWGWEWTDGWQRVLSVANGTVIITNPDGSQRLFLQDSRGGYFDEPGDKATLTAVSGGGFTLQEANGSITGFNPNGTVAYTEDTNGNKVNAVYTNGLLTSLVATTGQSLTFTWNSSGRITSITDSTGRTTTYTYDSTNQYLLAVSPADDDDDQYTYDTGSNPATQHALLSIYHLTNNATDHFVYNAQGQLIETDRNANADQVTYVNGPAGEISATDANGATTQYFFDSRGLLVKTVDPLGNATHYIFDSNFNLTQVIDAVGQVVTYSYDQNGNVIKTVGPDGETVTYTYSGPFNSMTSYTDPNGNTTKYGYDSKGNLLAITYANGSQNQFSYDPLGNLTQSINARGQAIHDTYNSMGELTQETFADGSFYTYAYDVHGNLISASDGTNTTTFQYDPTGDNLLQVNYPEGRFLKFTYDSGDRRTQSIDQNGFTVNYTYNAVGLLAELTDGNGNPIVTYTYDSMGRLIREDKGNGTYTIYAFDLAGNILHLVNYAPGGSVNSRFDYTYDSLGRRTSMTTLDGVWNYQYDPAGQLTHAVFASNNSSVVPNQDLQYVYDLAGNRTQTIINGVTTTYVTNNMNQYTQIDSANLTYDADGNLISQTDTTGTTDYTYDEVSRIIKVSSPTSTSVYQYDPLDNLASFTQNGQTTEYMVDPTGLGNVVAAYTGSGNLIANYTYGFGLTSLVANRSQS
jgi:YD repeat-containing protein